MRVIRSLSSETTFNQPILTLGTYDGVHLGHQAILKKLIQRAKLENKESVLFTFHPHPRMVLNPEAHGVRLIDTIEEKLVKLEALGLDTVILFPFTVDFSRLSAEEFVKQILVDTIQISEIHIGYDHHFGKNREGSFSELLQLGLKFGFEVFETSAVSISDTAISSTKIRNALLDGDISKAAHFLGRPYSIIGEVIHGNKLGRTIGFPTANIQLNEDKILPKLGVYAVTVNINGQLFQGVLNIGKKPTVKQTESISAEVFIFDFDQDIYGETINVDFYTYLRGEQRFDSVNSLKLQLSKDAEMARTVLLDLAN
jgi:riboflavin kinase / FMN adenylyltransferase